MKKLKKLSILQLALVFTAITIVFGATIGNYYSPTYTYTADVTGQVENSLDDSTYSTSPLNGTGSTAHFYCRFVTTASGHSGSVTVTWQLQWRNNTVWQDVPGATIFTSTTMTGSAGQIIYATSTGSQTGNQDWATYFSNSGQYRVMATFTA